MCATIQRPPVLRAQIPGACPAPPTSPRPEEMIRSISSTCWPNESLVGGRIYADEAGQIVIDAFVSIQWRVSRQAMRAESGFAECIGHTVDWVENLIAMENAD